MLRILDRELDASIAVVLRMQGPEQNLHHLTSFLRSTRRCSTMTDEIDQLGDGAGNMTLRVLCVRNVTRH